MRGPKLGHGSRNDGDLGRVVRESKLTQLPGGIRERKALLCLFDNSGFSMQCAVR